MVRDDLALWFDSAPWGPEEAVLANALLAARGGRSRASRIPLCRTALDASIVACAKRGDAAAAANLLIEAERAGHAAGRDTYTAVVIACINVGDLSRAEAWMILMKAAGFKISKTLVHSMVRALLSNNCGHSVEKISNWLMRIHVMGIGPLDRATVHLLMGRFAAAGEAAHTERWAFIMEQAGLLPSRRTLAMLVDACVGAGEEARADSWLHLAAQLGLIAASEPSAPASPRGQASWQSRSTLLREVIADFGPPDTMPLAL